MKTSELERTRMALDAIEESFDRLLAHAVGQCFASPEAAGSPPGVIAADAVADWMRKELRLLYTFLAPVLSEANGHGPNVANGIETLARLRKAHLDAYFEGYAEGVEAREAQQARSTEDDLESSEQTDGTEGDLVRRELAEENEQP